METICMNCQILFFGKNKKNITNSSSAYLAQREVKVKTNPFFFFFRSKNGCKLFVLATLYQYLPIELKIGVIVFASCFSRCVQCLVGNIKYHNSCYLFPENLFFISISLKHTYKTIMYTGPSLQWLNIFLIILFDNPLK